MHPKPNESCMEARCQRASSWPEKLASLWKRANGHTPAQACEVKRRKAFAGAFFCETYKLLPFWGLFYVGQTGRCLNDGLRKHCSNRSAPRYCHFAVHSDRFGCQVVFEITTSLGAYTINSARNCVKRFIFGRLGILAWATLLLS